MNETPRTDEHLRMKEENGYAVIVSRDFARQLETELADKEKQLAEMRAEIKSKSRLIEQMRESLKALRKYPNTYIATGQGGGIAENDLAMCDTALAAERGE